jgi:F-type H+-transporting ATPase subunit b
VFLLAFSGTAIQLVPDGTLLLHFALIIVMVAVLNATLLRPINRILEERERRTRGRLDEAMSIQATVDEKLRQYEGSLREARAEGYALAESERRAAQLEREKRLAEIRAEIGARLGQEKAALRVDQEEVKKELLKNAHARAAEIGAQILGRPLSS